MLSLGLLTLREELHRPATRKELHWLTIEKGCNLPEKKEKGREKHLGYDRPSKAVDWLIKKAKNSIDKLAELPPWHPTVNPATEDPDPHAVTAAVAVDSTEMGLTVKHSESSGCIDSWAIRAQIIITGQDSFLINISRWIPTP
ncbi:hypothetical protein F8388_019390 [Cannabis sativa]|uniref:TCP domain-containing protein n=1 Tax=Cannabis sativa TaxID=3483 RepID=A0A7J6FFQ5_CANSA|nr:hypothetical protein F8388_019390 [Cannabis sativa]